MAPSSPDHDIEKKASRKVKRACTYHDHISHGSFLLPLMFPSQCRPPPAGTTCRRSRSISSSSCSCSSRLPSSSHPRSPTSRARSPHSSFRLTPRRWPLHPWPSLPRRWSPLRRRGGRARRRGLPIRPPPPAPSELQPVMPRAPGDARVRCPARELESDAEARQMLSSWMWGPGGRCWG